MKVNGKDDIPYIMEKMFQTANQIFFSLQYIPMKSHESTIFDNASPVPADVPWPFQAIPGYCLVTRLYSWVYPHSITMKSSLSMAMIPIRKKDGNGISFSLMFCIEYPCVPNVNMDRFPNVFLVPSGND